MKIPSTYEHFVAHFVPGVVASLGLMIIFNDVQVSVINQIHGSIQFIIFVILSLFVGLFIDGSVFMVKGLIKNKNDRLPIIENEIQMQKYQQALKEYHYFAEFCLNGAIASLILFFACLFKLGLSCLFLISSLIPIVLVLCFFHYEKQFDSSLSFLNEK